MTKGTRVIKIGGRPQSDPALPTSIAQLWSAGSSRVVIVHGGGDEVTTLQSALGLEAQFVGGRRVTSAEDIDVVRMALSGSANKRLVAALVSNGVRALGLSGEDASLLTATPVDPARLGYVGAPHRANVELLWHLLDAGYMPVISPVSRNACFGATGPNALGNAAALNVNGDDAAAALAVALAANELLLVADVPGVMSDGAVIPQLHAPVARRLIAAGTAAGGMRAKLEAALWAIDGGVERVRIGDIAAITDSARGTLLLD
ncbi:MAG TPA: acetylglutamate kinase [Gemmatimonadaceae bacterium]|jgi:acetylglutamate kinase|nr:acetylglutamate kinase [Gemmatimonadaceae bacterium]